MSTRVNPIRLFVTHCVGGKRRLHAGFRISRSVGNFLLHQHQPAAGEAADRQGESQREDLRRQIAPCEVDRGAAGGVPDRARAGAVSNELCQGRRPPDRRHGELRFHRAAAEGHQGSRGRGERLERAQFDRCAAPPGAPSRNDALGHDRIQARLTAAVGDQWRRGRESSNSTGQRGPRCAIAPRRARRAAPASWSRHIDAENLDDQRGALVGFLIRHLAHRRRHGVFAAQGLHAAQDCA